ncbi:hypothetical protein VTP01DRAFT_10611 [Rhizomucor pusillus]|uniref:uncharacterized protein n=1 Tax=Rhizomucor pusillus TaxID=4840 RepID=UPI0037438AEB
MEFAGGIHTNQEVKAHQDQEKLDSMGKSASTTIFCSLFYGGKVTLYSSMYILSKNTANRRPCELERLLVPYGTGIRCRCFKCFKSTCYLAYEHVSALYVL